MEENDLQDAIYISKNKAPSISYKILHMRVLYTNPCRDTIVPSYVDAHWLKKGRGRPLLDEGYSLSFNSIGAALEANVTCYRFYKFSLLQSKAIDLSYSLKHVWLF